MSGSGFGSGGWGSMPWGGADQLLGEEACDLFLFDDLNMVDILAAPFIGGAGDPLQFVADYPNPPGGSNDLGILSGDSSDPSFPTDDAYLTATAVVDNQYTIEINVTFEDLPNDFTSVSTRHVMFGAVDQNGPCAAVFISKVGLAYAGAVHHVPGAPSLGTLVLDSTLQIIPGTAGYAPLGMEMTYRLAVSAVSGAVYLFATPTATLGITGHQLIAVLPVIDAGDLTYPPSADHAIISVRGTTTQPSRIALDRWCLSSFFDVPNIAPVANAGQDQAVRACSIALLDGSASFDPEGAPLLYQWRLIDAPPGSSFEVEGSDGTTFPISPFTGFTNKFYSQVLSDLEATAPVLTGDVLLISGQPRVVTGKGTDGNGFYVVVPLIDIPDNLGAAPFKMLRQNGLSAPASVKSSFFADVPGFYKFDLTVFDGSLYSQPAVVILNVLESVLPRGCTPDVKYLFGYIGDFWKLVEGAEALGVTWSGLAQVAATELYTLWQHEYSKSLRDIQRTIARRWLHYDLLLAEPLPELTRVRAIWSGVQSVAIPVVGDPGVTGTSLVLSSSLFEEDAILDWVSSTTAEEAAAELLNRLLEVDDRFAVQVLPDRVGSTLVIRIDAPFPFTISDASTATIFVAGESNGPVSGAGAAGGGAKTYVVDRSLAGLDIQEDDLLIIDGVGYRITRSINGSITDPDTFDQQRLTLKDELPVPAGTAWTISSTVSSELLDFYQGLVSDGDNISFEVASISGVTEPEMVEVTATGVCPALPSVLGIDATALGIDLLDTDKTVYLAKCTRRTYLPISPLLKDLPALQEHIVVEDDEATLRRNVDFFLETFRGAPALRFMSGVGEDVWEAAVPPDRLWAEYSYIDNNPVIEANFGIPAGFTLDDLAQLPGDVDYLSAVSGLWYAFFNGPTPDNIRVGAQIFLGLPFAEEAGTIEEIRTDFSPSSGRILIRDDANEEIVRSYTYPNALDLEVNSGTNLPYAVGDHVSQFAPLVEGVEIIDYVKQRDWFRGLVSQRVFYEVQKYHTFSVRVDSSIFNLSALLLVKDFVLTIKPTYTYPVVVVSLTSNDSDLSILDSVSYTGRLILNDDTCQNLGATMFDDARPGAVDESWWNKFDSDETPPDPTYPTADSDVPWGFDKEYLCPEDSLVVDIIYNQAIDGPALFDTFLAFDTSLTQAVEFTESSPIVVPAVPGDLAITPVGSTAAVFNGNINLVRLLVVGSGPGAFDTDYELVVEVNGSEVYSLAFDATDPVFEVEAAVTLPVLTSDTITFKIRIPLASSSPGARTPDWASVSALVTVEDGPWSFDDTVVAGTYFIQIPI
jgi:hypothetical protein